MYTKTIKNIQHELHILHTYTTCHILIHTYKHRTYDRLKAYECEGDGAHPRVYRVGDHRPVTYTINYILVHTLI